MRDIVFVVLPDTLLLDLAGPAEAFRLANQQLARRGKPAEYRLRCVGPRSEAVSSVGATLAALEPLPEQLLAGTRVVLLGQPSGTESPLQRPLSRAWTDTRRWLARVVAPRLQGDGADLMLATVCAGALLAADAGLIGTRRCTTHHEMLAALQALAPAAAVQSNRLFVIDGPLASSAGITAGIDLALHLVARDLGEAVAAAVAQTMVVHLRRGPDDPELSPLLAGRNHLHPAVHRVQDAVSDQPAADWSLAAMAAVAHVTPRHLARLFGRHVGRSPRAYLQSVRLVLAESAIAAGQPPKRALGDAGIAGERQWRRLRQRRRAAPAPDQGAPSTR
jgi:transcriptional regulator GlxA family with amidase domain